MNDARIVELLEAILAAVTKPAANPEPRETVSIAEAMARLGCSRTRVFALLKDGTLQRSKRIGRRLMLLASSVEAAAKIPAPADDKPKAEKRKRPVTFRASVADPALADRIRALPV